MEEKRFLTFEELMAGFAEIREQQKENAKGFARIEKMHEKNEREFEKQRKDNAKGFEELRKELSGIGRSNGKMAEDYFFNSLDATKTLGGVHFDFVERNWKSSIPLENGKTLDGEYDITLINKDYMGIVEVKFTDEKDDVENLVKKQVETFKRLFPIYANYKFYLAIGGMSINKQAEDEAKKLGVGMLKLNGDAVEINDKNLKVY